MAGLKVRCERKAGAPKAARHNSNLALIVITACLKTACGWWRMSLTSLQPRDIASASYSY
ncbi:hypothetical protein A6J69_001395 [Hafnia paralvei]|jgi:hypothetical protein|nr:hypothetical protein A6J69_001395 [Hafnia paralvei]